MVRRVPDGPELVSSIFHHDNIFSFIMFSSSVQSLIPPWLLILHVISTKCPAQKLKFKEILNISKLTQPPWEMSAQPVVSFSQPLVPPSQPWYPNMIGTRYIQIAQKIFERDGLWKCICTQCSAGAFQVQSNITDWASPPPSLLLLLLMFHFIILFFFLLPFLSSLP